jgi:hydroxymethylpyrimidine pyrophosphatase-like HAD family hydrolase
MSTQSTTRPETLVPQISNDGHIAAMPGWDALATAQAATTNVSTFDFAEISRTTADARERSTRPLPVAFLESEEAFYGQYGWCLNAFPRLQEVAQHLTVELKKVDHVNGWQYSEVVTNTFLLSCAITDTIDDYLLGNTLDFSKLVRILPIAAPAVRIVHKVLDWRSRVRLLFLIKLRAWRDAWAGEVTDFLQHAVIRDAQPASALKQRDRLIELLTPQFDKDLASLRPKIPAFFRSRDFATPDCLELARKLILQFPDSDRPAIVVGLRTAGSFLAPLVCAHLRSHGHNASWIAIRPVKGLASWERRELELASKRNSRALITDESVHSGQTLAKSISLLRKAGFAEEDIVVLNPVEPALPDWKSSRLFQALSKINVITLEPRERYKCRFLDSQIEIEKLLDEYFTARGYSEVRVVTGSETERLNATWRDQPPERVDHRLKRIYEVHLKDAAGSSEIRYVLAKSVGWGWLGYHAFIAGQRLAKWTAPILGMREGILYSEWISQNVEILASGSDREPLVESLASYVAARAKNLCLEDNPITDLVNDDRHKGVEILASSLLRAYGSRMVAASKRSDLRRQLARQNQFLPVVTDSKMGSQEWIVAGDSPRKLDFEHHCFGKNELSITDPAFDLASAILYFGLSEMESDRLVERYVEESGDKTVEQRMFFNKLLASMRAQSLADHDLGHPRLLSQRSVANRQYISAWNFLVGESVRECAKLSIHPKKIEWHTPLVVADIDGVLDRMVFGFPCTTAAGIKAISLLHAHGFCIAVNTARTLQEVKQYCRAYAFAGGVAEYGAILWDAISGQERVLVAPESLEQVRRARDAFRRIPGCFLNDDYLYSLRVFTYQNGRTAPVPPLLAQDLLAGLNADRLRVHHTGLDTAIVAKATDKGLGLTSLLDFVGLPKVDVVAIGDSEPDLAMFRVANGSFAPGNVTCPKEAELLGCSIARSSYQPGLLEIAQRIVHPKGGTCDRCKDIERGWPKEKTLFVSLLEAADQKPWPLLLRNFHSLSFLAPFKK